MSEWRCNITGNPVNTDTVMIGAPCCMCNGCRSARKIERLRAQLDDALQLGQSAEAAHKHAIAEVRAQLEAVTRERDLIFSAEARVLKSHSRLEAQLETATKALRKIGSLSDHNVEMGPAIAREALATIKGAK